MSDITIITPHRDRTEQLELVIQCINRQTLKPDKWIIVDDGMQRVPPQVISKSFVPIQYIWYPRQYTKSASQNSLLAMQKVTTNKCIVIQDDDYYPPNYIQTISNLLQDKQNLFLGNSAWYIYRLSTGYYIIRDGQKMKNSCFVQFQWHSAAFAGRRLRQDLIKYFSQHKGQNRPPDVLAQELINKAGYEKLFPDLGGASCISLKDYGVGAPGWMGDHRRNNQAIRDTDDFSKFKEWLGCDWIRYKKYLGRLR